MYIVIAGGTGFIGEPLVKSLTARGDVVSVLTRHPEKVRAGRGVAWNPPAKGEWASDPANADAAINLPDENICAGRRMTTPPARGGSDRKSTRLNSSHT